MIRPLFGDIAIVGIGLLCVSFVILLVWDAWQQKRETDWYKDAELAPVVPPRGSRLHRARYLLLAVAALGILVLVRENEAEEKPVSPTAAGHLPAGTGAMVDTNLWPASWRREFVFDYDHVVHPKRLQVADLSETTSAAKVMQMPKRMLADFETNQAPSAASPPTADGMSVDAHRQLTPPNSQMQK